LNLENQKQKEPKKNQKIILSKQKLVLPLPTNLVINLKKGGQKEKKNKYDLDF
jgi:hypothetical protein